MEKLTLEQKNEITKISQQFAEGLKDTCGDINGSGWLIVDPLSAYLSVSGYDNELHQIPATDKNPLILIMTFKDDSQFIPAGKDLAYLGDEAELKKAENWIWL
jgi:hypothetical protein